MDSYHRCSHRPVSCTSAFVVCFFWNGLHAVRHYTVRAASCRLHYTSYCSTTGTSVLAVMDCGNYMIYAN